MTPGDIPLELEVRVGRHHDEMQTCPTRQIGPIKVHEVRAGERFALRVENPTTEPVYAHLIAVTPAGRLEPVRLWSYEILVNGLAPGAVETSLPMKSREVSGFAELWLYTFPFLIDELISPTATISRAIVSPFALDYSRAHLRKLYFLLSS